MKNFFVLLLVLSFGRLAMAGVDISGEYRFREWRNQKQLSGQTTENRFLLSFAFREGDSLMAKMSLAVADASQINELYGVWNFADAFEFKFGTFAMDWANGSVFAKNSFDDKYTSFNGVSLAYDAGMVKVVYAELNRTSIKDLKMQAVSVDFMSLPAIAKTAHLFFVKKNDLTKYGAVVAGSVDMFNYDLTYASDKNGDASATMIHAKAGVEVLNLGTVVATYHKDEAGYDPLHYSKHKNAGLMDAHGWGGENGLTYYTVGYVHSLNDSSVAGVLYNNFTATKSGDKLGTEIDVYTSHKYNDALTATARYGKYTPETGDAYNQWMLGLNLSF